jgi:hypothetical protein
VRPYTILYDPFTGIDEKDFSTDEDVSAAPAESRQLWTTTTTIVALLSLLLLLPV